MILFLVNPEIQVRMIFPMKRAERIPVERTKIDRIVQLFHRLFSSIGQG